MESRLSQSLFTNFSFTWWNSGYHEAFSWTFLFHNGFSAITEPFHEFFFHTMKFWLSRILLMNFSFSEWIPGYHEAFSQIFLSHDGILVITKPSHELFFFTMESRLSRSLSNDKIHKMRELGEDSFHIYHKEYLHRTCCRCFGPATYYGEYPK
jgi:hypothetical protein